MHWPLTRVAVAERSMEPALRPGDWLLVWRTRRVRAGQIVLARHPGRPDLLIVKRGAHRVPDGGWWVGATPPAPGAGHTRRFGPVPGALIEGRVLARYWRPRHKKPGDPASRGATWLRCGDLVVDVRHRVFAVRALLVDQREHLFARQLGAHRPEVDDHAEPGDGEDVPPKRDVEGVGRRLRVLVARRGPAVLALPGDDAHADQPGRQPYRRLPLQLRPLRVEGHEDAHDDVAEHQDDAELPDHLEARPVDEQAGDGERGRGEHAGDGHPVRPVRVGHLAAERAQGERRARVHQHAGPGDQPDQRVPARERQQEEQADDEREDQPDPRDAPGVHLAEDLREVPVPGQAVADPRSPGRVDQAGTGRGDERVDPQEERQPGEADHAREACERPGQDVRVGDAGEALAQLARGHRGDERDLQQDVDYGPDQDRYDDRPRQVAPRVLDLAGQLVGLLEAGVGEDDARG